ncbi:MAG TPA: serine hydrolase domain-containing protein [Armatimonadota bacterium]|nr:serine hydrolase domain-containing protein [Armatimonadota bacterium]
MPVSAIRPLFARWCAALILTACSATLAGAAGAPSPTDVGMDPGKLSEIRQRMKGFARERKIAGAVTLVARKGRVVELDAVGDADIENHRPMRPNTLFWLASQAKPITATAVMILVDEGKLSLDQPASKWMPELKQPRLRNGGPALHPVTLRHLLSHTAGLAQPPRDPNDGAIPLSRYASSIASRPLEFEPGSAYEYGYGPTVAGRIVEIASGMPFDVFLRQRIFRPLGMVDTTFHPDEQQRRRLAKTYMPGPDGHSLVPAYNPFITQDATVRRTPEPSGGLFSTAPDMARFYQMVLNGGELDGKRILSRGAVEEMTRPVSAGGKPLTYGLCWQTFRSGQPGSGAALEGFGHGGAFATDGFIDPKHEVVGVLMIQRTLFPNGGEISGAFRQLVAESIR